MKKERVKLNDGHYTEIIDRIYIQMDNIDFHLLKHPAVENNKELKKLLEKSLTILYKAYQQAALESIKINKRNKK
jgi:hypothetical protein